MIEKSSLLQLTYTYGDSEDKKKSLGVESCERRVRILILQAIE